MSKFKVLNSTVLEGERGYCLMKFVVAQIDGAPQSGETFVAFNTYHRINFAIRSAASLGGGKLELVCAQTAPGLGHFDGFFDSAVIDTSGCKRGEHFFYDHGVDLAREPGSID
jgi:hypothetical protein